MKPMILNVVSGKGGTGKTLFAAMLADMLGNIDKRVLCVDMDVFVRGLTALLYFHKKEALKILEDFVLPTYAVFNVTKSKGSKSYIRVITQELGICRYRSFHVLPAVSRIDENLALSEVLSVTKKEAKLIVEALIKKIPKEYDIILIDSRAGYDDLISAMHSASNISICIEEEDPVARITADNLVRQLQTEAATPLFRLVNKARGIRSAEEIEQKLMGVSDLGLIPFDIDVMNSFGSLTFWDDIAKSFYKSSLARAWNRLSAKMRLDCDLPISRISPIASEKVEQKLGTLIYRDRVLFIFGLLVGVLGISFAFTDFDFFYKLVHSPLHLVTLILGICGLILSFYVVFRIGIGPRRKNIQ